MAPHVVINCAMSADGKIALPTRKQTKISNPEDLRRVHALRNRSDAILVGIETVLSDDPKLTVKRSIVPNPKNPIRIVLDSRGRTPYHAQIFCKGAKTIVAVTEACDHKMPKGETLVCGKDWVDLKKLLKILDKRGIKTLLVEGGETVIWSFLSQGLADEFIVFVGSMVIGGVTSPTPAGGMGVSNEKTVIPLKLKKARRIGDGILLHYEVER